MKAEVIPRARDFVYAQRPGNVQPRPSPTYVHVLALRSDGVSYICVSLRPTTIISPVALPAKAGDTVDFDDSHASIALAAPIRRVATSAAPIAKLSAAADTQENLTIDWTDANGGQGHLFYPASYPARSPNSIK